MDITIDTGENKVIVHLEKFNPQKSFAVMINSSSGVTVKTTLDDLIKAIEVIAGHPGEFSAKEKRANKALS